MTSPKDVSTGAPSEAGAAPGPDPGGWRCPQCDAERLDADAFCGRCGARRPMVPAVAAAAAGEAEVPRRGVPLTRTLLLNGALVGAVVLAVVFARGDGPSAITFEPGTWRCDGTERAWVATVASSAIDVRTEWRLGGPEGEIHATAVMPRIALEAYATGAGSIRFATDAVDAPECGLEPGTWTMALRDDANNALLAHGDVELAAP